MNVNYNIHPDLSKHLNESPNSLVTEKPVVIIGAGIGGLSAAIFLAAQGVPVRVLEKASGPGGKMRQVDAGGALIDAGPTVFTMRWVFEEMFAAAQRDLDSYMTTRPAEVLARHAWSKEERLDLFIDRQQSADAIREFAGPREAEAFLSFTDEAARIYATLKDTFIAASRPGVIELTRRVGFGNLGALRGIKPFSTMWKSLSGHFGDPRLRQLFGRYATYCGSSPFEAPATLMLVAHVEGEGVWLVDGGMISVAKALADCACDLGATISYDSEVRTVDAGSGRADAVVTAEGETVAAAAVVANADPGAFPSGFFGAASRRAVSPIAPAHRSLSAVTWAYHAEADGFPLTRHNVFFSDDYVAEFTDIFKSGRLPEKPTVYVCAQDRDDAGARIGNGPERLMCLVNAPPRGDAGGFDPEEMEKCETAMLKCLAHGGLAVQTSAARRHVTTPATFEKMFPGSGGALYGPASHGWAASFRREGARTKLPGLYLAGGAVHPGPGVPMAALSGRRAAEAVMADLTST